MVSMARKTLDEIRNTSMNYDELNYLKSMPDDKIDYSDIPVLNDEQIAGLKSYKIHQNSMIEIVMKLPKSACFDDVDAVSLQRQ
ncbi:hypothetical protein [Moraxella sp. ZY210820]|uniref:hypothetical protein n=1 Tax=unclassified Moraxella TaxID=2685852 RepID=UPI002731A1C3|nr:hypothetical protein [Moraxella sp. ZY210820]WLF84246.1 hypothetical protein LU301_01755 [Moraxella sp. ZY210820]